MKLPIIMDIDGYAEIFSTVHAVEVGIEGAFIADGLYTKGFDADGYILRLVIDPATPKIRQKGFLGIEAIRSERGRLLPDLSGQQDKEGLKRLLLKTFSEGNIKLNNEERENIELLITKFIHIHGYSD